MKIHFTALFRSAAGTSSVDLEVTEDIPIQALEEMLVERFGPPLAALFQGGDAVLAVNGRVVRRDALSMLAASDEVTFLMPLAGG